MLLHRHCGTAKSSMASGGTQAAGPKTFWKRRPGPRLQPSALRQQTMLHERPSRPGKRRSPGRQRQSLAKRVPLGVVGVITPWNSPLILAIRAAAPALALGNAVLLKPDVQAPVSGGALIAQLFEEAGLPPGVLHILPGDAETGEALVLDRNVNMISFTGSTAVGRRVGELAGRGLKRVSLELGGNNAYIVLDDADVEKAVAAGAFGSYFFQGQICFTAGRHLVHERVADRYIELLKARTRDLRVGDPFRDQVDLGP